MRTVSESGKSGAAYNSASAGVISYPTMLTVYRRHLQTCPHKAEGRRYRRCKCPIWIDGFAGGRDVRESMRVRDWEKAHEIAREWELTGRDPRIDQPTTEPTTIAAATAAFIADAEARGLAPSTRKKYRVLFDQLSAFAAHRGMRYLTEWNTPTLRTFRESWTDASISASKKLERLRSFFRFCVSSKWLQENPAAEVKPPKVRYEPTMPLTSAEVQSLLQIASEYHQRSGEVPAAARARLRAFLLLLRYSGMRIGDAASCSIDRISGNKLLLYTAKTGVPVYVVLPPVAVQALEQCPRLSARYWFWTGFGSIDTLTGNWRRTLRKLGELAGIPNPHPHRFRDTFAVELLLAGVPIERVSILLGHSSIKVTERHYAPWVRSRQEQIEQDLAAAWERDPLSGASKIVTMPAKRASGG